jgi:hypothetical protein
VRPEIVEIVEIAGLVLGAALTLTTFSYLIGDNFLYRLGVHLFIGTLVGYTLGIVLREVLVKMALAQLPDNPILIVPLVMGLWLLFFKSIPRLAYVGNFVVAYLVGVGTAVALSGALLGTLIPQIKATGYALGTTSQVSFPLGILDGLLVVVGTLCTLMVFNFTANKRRGLAGLWGQFVRLVAGVGRIFLLFALSAAFAGALTASLSLFMGRVQYLIDAFFYVADSLGG